jgi:hypothetical protein
MLCLFLPFNMPDAISLWSVLAVGMCGPELLTSNTVVMLDRAAICPVVAAAKCGRLNMHCLQATVAAAVLLVEVVLCRRFPGWLLSVQDLRLL